MLTITEYGWTRYQVCVSDFDFTGELVDYREYAHYDYELNQEQLAALEGLLTNENEDTQEAQPCQ